MISWLRRYRRPLFIFVGIVFLGGIFVGLGGYLFSGAASAEAVAVVGGAEIPYARFRNRFNQYMDLMQERKVEVNEQMQAQVKQEILREMIVDELLAGAAESMGLSVSDTELSLSIRNTPAFQRDGKFDQELYFQAVRLSLRSTPEQFEEEQRRAMLSAKLKSLVARASKVSPAEIREEYVRENKGSDKDFDKKGAEFAQALRQRRAVDAVNSFLRQLVTKVEVQSFLEQRERGG